jgi:hypothetical protein
VSRRQRRQPPSPRVPAESEEGGSREGPARGPGARRRPDGGPSARERPEGGPGARGRPEGGGGARGRPEGPGARGRPAAGRGSDERRSSDWARRLVSQTLLLAAVLAVTTLVAELAGAANLGIALGIGQIAFAIALVALMLTR